MPLLAPACDNLVTLREATKGSSLTERACKTVITQGVECLKAENIVDLALKGYERLPQVHWTLRHSKFL